MKKTRIISFILAMIIASLPMGYSALAGKGTKPTPTPAPTAAPTAEPTEQPTAAPTAEPTAAPTDAPTGDPTAAPTAEPTKAPKATEVPVDGTFSMGGKIEISVTAKKSVILRLKVKSACDATLQFSGVPVKAELKNEKTGVSTKYESSSKGVLKIEQHLDKGDYLLTLTIQKGRKAGTVTIKAIGGEQPEEDKATPAPEAPDKEDPAKEDPAVPETDVGNGEGDKPRETAVPAQDKKVTVVSSANGVIREGEVITLTGRLEGFDGYEIRYQWECDRGDGFRPVDNADGATWSFTATEETLRWNWRLTVYYR